MGMYVGFELVLIQQPLAAACDAPVGGLVFHAAKISAAPPVTPEKRFP